MVSFIKPSAAANMKQYLMPSYGEIMKHALTCKAIGAEVCSSVWCEFVLVKVNMNQLGVILYLNMYVCKFEPIQHVFRQKAFCKESILFHSYTLFYSLQRGQGIFIAINYTHVFSGDPEIVHKKLVVSQIFCTFMGELQQVTNLFDMTTDYKVTELFCIIDEFCKHFEAENAGNLLEDNSGAKRRRRQASLSDSEIMTILLYFHFGTFRNFKHYYLFFIKGTMKSYFPKAVSYNRFVELESRVFFQLMFFLNLGAFGRCTGITFVDSTMIPVCHNLRRYANKVFKGIATDGKGTMGWCHGFKLHLACNDRGEIIAFVLTGANVSDKDPKVFKVLAKRLYGKMFADKGYISQKLFDFLFEDGIQLVTGLRVNMKNKLIPFYDRMMLRKRYIIETINDMLKNTAQIVHSRHRSVSNFIMNLISALGAYCFFDNKPKALQGYCIEDTKQLSLF